MLSLELAFFIGMGIAVIIAIFVFGVSLCLAGWSVWKHKKTKGEIAPYTTYWTFMKSALPVASKNLFNKKK